MNLALLLLLVLELKLELYALVILPEINQFRLQPFPCNKAPVACCARPAPRTSHFARTTMLAKETRKSTGISASHRPLTKATSSRHVTVLETLTNAMGQSMYAPPSTFWHLRAPQVLSSALLAFVFAAPVVAQASQWPTSKWVVGDQVVVTQEYAGRGGHEVIKKIATPVDGERAKIAAKHVNMLQAASRWYQALGFPAPVQLTEDLNLAVASDEAYAGELKASPDASVSSSHDSDGVMKLTANPDFLTANTPLWKLMEASAVHELYHGIQATMNPSLEAARQAPKLWRCIKGKASDEDRHIVTDLSWVVEGSAAMVQIRWLERQTGTPYGHPFKGSPRAAWVRHFDQSLPLASLPADLLNPPAGQTKSPMRKLSWSCDYGAWYFWYAVGDMLGRDDAEKVSYLQYLYGGPNAWGNAGIGAVDAGLKRAAQKYDAIGPYRNGLYDLYPQFVAQYLTDDRFYAHLEKVDLGTPGLYQTASVPAQGPRGPIEALASRAWRFRIQLPEGAAAQPYNVRFTLDAPGKADLDTLHLIVDDKLYTRHADRTIPYAAVLRTDRATPSADGSVEYLVRVANVGLIPGQTAAAPYSLRVEVDGFYGSDVSSAPTAGQITAATDALPPGFSVRGPGPWTCSGNAKTRAIFDLVTPDELGRDVDRLLPGMTHSTDTQMKNLEVMLKRMKLGGAPTGGMTREQLAQIRQKAEAAMAAAQPKLKARADAAATQVRANRTSTIAATFVGTSGNGECQMILGATLAGREGGAQIIPRSVNDTGASSTPKPAFDVAVYPAKALQLMRSFGRSAGMPQQALSDPLDGWKVCSMNDAERREARAKAATSNCPAITCTPGRLTLEAAQQGRIAGSFQFEVIRWAKQSQYSQCPTVLGRDNVTGHFNVNSTDNGHDDNGLSGINFGLGGGTTMTPGAPILNVGENN